MNWFKLLTYLQKTKSISRRDFFDMLKKNVIFLNWETVKDINQTINLNDTLQIKLPNWEIYQEKIEKKPIFKPVIIIFNKPLWYVVSKEDKHNKTIFELLPKSWKKDFYYIWRLDKDSHWLLLLTNDPSIVDYYENPKNNIIKIYEVQIDKPFKTNHILKTKKGLYVDQDWNIVNPLNNEVSWEELKFSDIKKFTDEKWKHMLRILLTEWKKRHIRRVLKALWYKIKDLQRIKEWKYQLWDIRPWKYRIYNI